MPNPTGPQFDPMPGDTMTSLDTGNVYTVVSTDVRYVYTQCPVPGAPKLWPRLEWSEDGGGMFTYARPAPAHAVRTHLVLRAVADALRAYDKSDDEGGVPAHDILWKLLCDVEASTSVPHVGGTWTELAGQLDVAALGAFAGDL